MQTEPMVALELNAVLWSNWQAWAAGGVTDSEIMAHLTEADLVKLRQDLAERSTDPSVWQLDRKTIIDVATWICHGTHSLLLLPIEIRLYRVAEAAETLGVNQQLLLDVFKGPDLLPNQQ